MAATVFGDLHNSSSWIRFDCTDCAMRTQLPVNDNGRVTVNAIVRGTEIPRNEEDIKDNPNFNLLSVSFLFYRWTLRHRQQISDAMKLNGKTFFFFSVRFVFCVCFFSGTEYCTDDSIGALLMIVSVDAMADACMQWHRWQSGINFLCVEYDFFFVGRNFLYKQNYRQRVGSNA